MGPTAWTLIRRTACAACLSASALTAVAPFAQLPELASVSMAGGVGNDDSWETSISADGRYVAFVSFASDLVPGDQNGKRDAFLRDRWLAQTRRLNVDSAGAEGNGTGGGPSVAGGGSCVAFYSDANNLVAVDGNNEWDVFVHELANGAVTRVSVSSSGVEGNGASGLPSINFDGRYLSFTSASDNLDVLDPNSVSDVYLHDRVLATTTLVSRSSTGVVGNNRSSGSAISADGRCVAFVSIASNLVPGDTNATFDVFIHDVATAQTERVSVATGGDQGNAASGWEPLTSFNLVALSADARYAAFASLATNLVPADSNGFRDVFVRDRLLGTTDLVSRTAAGLQGNGDSHSTHNGALSAEGRFVAFYSEATNFAPGDSNAVMDCFVHDRWTGEVQRVSNTASGDAPSGASAYPSIAAHVPLVSFHSYASELAPPDANTVRDAFLASFTPRCAAPASYCQAKLNSQGCLPNLSYAGEASASAAEFRVTAAQLINQKLTLLVYGLAGPSADSFLGGTLCVRPPLVRLPPAQSAGNPPPDDCSGLATFDFLAWFLSGNDPALTTGVLVCAQVWSRDPALAGSEPVSLSNALAFRFCP